MPAMNDPHIPLDLQCAVLLAKVPCAIAVLDRQMCYVAVSKLWESTFNIAAADVLGRSHYAVFPTMPSDRKSIHDRCLRGETATCEAEPFTWSDGSVRWLKWSISPWRDEKGAVGGLAIIFEVVTQQVQLQRELRHRDDLNRALVRQFPDAVVVVFDHDLRLLLVEGGGLAAAQFPREETEGRLAHDALSPYAAQRIIPAYRRALEGEPQHFEYLGRDGSTQFDVHVAPIRDEQGAITAGLAVARDITRQKQAQRLLIESELRYRMIVEDQTELILRFNLTQHITFANGAYLRYFALESAQVVGSPLTAHLPPSVYAALQTALPHLRPDAPTRTLETKIKVAGSKRRWLAWTLRLITDAQGAALEYQAVAHDISRIKRAEKAERRHRAVSDALREIAVVLHSTLDLNTVLDCIMDTIHRVVPHPFANVMLIRGAAVEVVRSRGYTPDVTARLAHRQLEIVTSPHLQTMLDTQQALVLPTIDDARALGNVAEWRWVHSYVGTPILAQGQVIGFINLESAEVGTFKKKHAKQLHAFAEHAALAIRNAQLHQQYQELAVWEERQRIARELHDAVSQTLFSVNLIADALPNMWTRTPTQVPPKLAELRQQTQIALTEMRTLLFELRPQALQDIPLEHLIDHLVRTLVGRTAVRVDFRPQRAAQTQLPEAVKLALYRVVQEAINNIIRHSLATRATITCVLATDQASVEICDDGCGFDLSIPFPGHLGLRIMRERAEAIGAALHIQSQPGLGTTIRLSVRGNFAEDFAEDEEQTYDYPNADRG